MIESEIYVLCSARSEDVIYAFLDKFASKRAVTTDEYPIPENSDNPIEIIYSEQEIFRKLVKDTNEPYAFYWNCVFPIKTAMLFFTKDGNLIVGLAVYEPHVQSFYQKILLSVGGVCGYVQATQEESPPPNCQSAFIKRANDYRKAN
ncbi:MAG: hypothetical protein ACRCXK_12860 [Wohlfahrtiimonas sp.]